MKLILTWIFTGVGSLLNFISDDDFFSSIMLDIPSNQFFTVTGYLKDILTILCFIAALLASLYTIKEKIETIRKIKDGNKSN